MSSTVTTATDGTDLTQSPPQAGTALRPSSTRRGERPLTVIVAMLANLVLALAKFVVAAVTGSAALFAEGVHSVVDTMNQGVLLFGERSSRRPADLGHPFGYGKEVYFWALIYSVLLFGVGGGVSIYKGIDALQSPELAHDVIYSYVVLAVALVAEGASWLYALRAVAREQQGATFADKLRATKDPTRFAVVAEDFAALVGVIIAAAGIGLSEVLRSPVPDAIASILIGVTLCVASVALTRRTRSLLVGQAASPQVVREIEQIVSRSPGVRYAGTPLTMHLGPAQVVAAINVKFEPDLSAADVARCVDELEQNIRSRFPEVARIFIEAQLATGDVEREQPAG